MGKRSQDRRARRIRAAERRREADHAAYVDEQAPERPFPDWSRVKLTIIGERASARTMAMEPEIGFLVIPGAWPTLEEFFYALDRLPLSQVTGQFWD